MRAVTADHVRFLEAIQAFRPERVIALKDPANAKSYLLSSFDVTTILRNERFELAPSAQVMLDGSYKAILLPVTFFGLAQPFDGAHISAQAVAAILTLVSERPVIAPRDPRAVERLLRNPTSADAVHALAYQFPLLGAGPGAVTMAIPADRQRYWAGEMLALVKILMELDYKKYTRVMQAIRLYQLALTEKRTDFDLAFSLLIASMEAMATLAIKRSAVVAYDAEEEKVLRFCQESGDEALVGWFSTNIRDRAKLKARFIAYINTFAPVSAWSAVRHPQQDLVDVMRVYGVEHDHSWMTEKRWREYYPEDLTLQQLEKIISDTYFYRSGFVHEGNATPHSSPMASNRFFDDAFIIGADGKLTQRLMLTFDAIATIARISLLAACAQIAKKVSTYKL
jgi:hypothetical protein